MSVCQANNIYDVKPNGLEYDVISNLRFPLMLSILFIHSFPETVISGSSLYVQMRNLCWFANNPILTCSVFIFFFFSGFLFFQQPDFNCGVYVRKLRHRYHSLFIPYIFWISVTIIIRYAVEIFIPSMSSPLHLPISQYTFKDFILAYWNTDGVGPIYTPFWFLRDLIVMSIFSPLVYLLIKKLKYYGLLLIFLFEYFIGSGCVSHESIVCFSIGAFFGIMKMSFISCVKPFYKFSLVSFLPLSYLGFLFRNCDRWWLVAITYVSAFCLVVLTFNIASRVTEKGFKINKVLTSSSFFLYAYHGLLSVFIAKICMRYLSVYGFAPIVVCYFCLPIFIALFGAFLYALLRNWLPRFTALITGGR